MKLSEKNWKVGEVVNLPKREKQLKKSGITTYTRFVTSRYVCIREATEGQRGILVKVLGKCFADDLMIVSGHPFCKDDRDELLEGVRYLSFPFPQTRDVQEVIDIVRENPDLINAFSSASMHINPDSTFWIDETSRSMLILKKPQFLNGRTGQLHAADDANHTRISLVYFSNGKLAW